MSKIVIGNRLSEDPALPDGHKPQWHLGVQVAFDTDLLLATRLLITADSGGGKSWLGRRLFEQAFGKVQQIIVDPEGEFASLREKFPFVLVGKGGDTPADVRSAALLAHRLLKLRVSAICDLYELKPDDRHVWVRNFCEALIEAPKELRTPLILALDEMHMFAPEKGQGESEAKAQVIDVGTRGRKRGSCLVGMTQRLAMLDKSVTSQLQNRLVGGQFEEVNIVTAFKLFGIPPGAPQREFREQIQLLDPGQFFAYGRAISRERILLKVGDVQTSHPKAFEKHTAPPPPTPEKVKKLLPQLADLPQEAEKKAFTEAEYKKQIRELTQKLSAVSRQPSAKPAEPDPAKLQRTIDTQVYRAVKARDAQWNAAVRLYQRDLVDKLGEVSAAQVKTIREIVPFHFVPPSFVPPISQANAPEPEPASPLVPGSSTAQPPRRPEVNLVKGTYVPNPNLDKKLPPSNGHGGDPAPPKGDGSTPLSSVARQIAGILAAYHPEPMKRSILAALCGVVDGGSFSNRLSECRVAGLLEDPERGMVKATEECVRQFAGTFQAPANTEEVLALWAPKLGQLARQILRKLVDAGGEAVRRSDLAESLGLVDGGSFSNRLSECRVAGLLVDPSRGMVAANREALFLEKAEAAKA